MSPSFQPLSPADARHWRRSRRLTAVLTLIWLAVSFGPLLFAREPEAEELAIAQEFLQQPADAGPTPWEQLAQALLATNEMLYVD